jgi:phage gp36-like protein
VLTGTPVLSFSLLGTSHQTYCNNQDLSDLAIPNVALGDIVPEVRANACLVASDEAASYLGQDHDMPLQSWGNALRLHTANMAVYHLMKRRGFNPEADEIIRLGYTDAIAWLKSGARTDKSIVDTTPEATSNAAYMVSRPARGWSHR